MKVKFKKVFRKLLPGIISGGADNDPAGISTYSIAGAQFGYQQLWLLVLSTPMLIAVQAMCARLGDVKRKGLMLIIREHFHPYIAISSAIILIVTNIATIGADFAGVADVIGLVSDTPYIYWILPVTISVWYIVVFKSYRVIEKYLAMLSFVFVAYIFSAFLAKPDWGKVFISLLVPKFPLTINYFIAALGLLGTTITPFLFFWQTRQEIEEHNSPKELLLKARHVDRNLAPGLIFSSVISFFIIVSTAAVFNSNGIFDINSAADAAKSLEPFAGPMAKYLFSIGIIGAGLLAIPVLAVSTAYVVSETFGWHEGLDQKFARAKGFYLTITASLIVGMIIVATGVDPMKALLYSQVLSGMLAPFLIIIILLLSNSRKIMGENKNSKFDNIFGWMTVLVMIAGSIGFFWQLAFGV
ncbi:NRAMP family divalent metal transporter [Patescibacteria group bacterium]